MFNIILNTNVFILCLGPIGNDGNACPASCPPACPADHMTCGGGVDANGCQMPDTCAPMTGYVSSNIIWVVRVDKFF